MSTPPEPDRARDLDWGRARPLLERALAAPADEREALLERAADDDPDLARALRRLLRAGSRFERALEPPGIPRLANSPLHRKP